MAMKDLERKRQVSTDKLEGTRLLSIDGSGEVGMGDHASWGLRCFQQLVVRFTKAPLALAAGYPGSGIKFFALFFS